MVPTALVRPSLKTSFWSQCRYSGVLMKRKWTEALSPVRRQSLFMVRMVAVCLMLPQWTVVTEREWPSYSWLECFRVTRWILWGLALARLLSATIRFKGISRRCHSPMAWYLGDIVVGWCRTRISASNSQVACGISFGDTITMPFLIDERLIWDTERERTNKNSRSRSEKWGSGGWWSQTQIRDRTTYTHMPGFACIIKPIIMLGN